jgi:hypothetical protein
LSLIETKPLSQRLPPVEGDHLTLMLQEPPAVTLAPQELVWEKAPEEVAMPLMFSVVRPTLVSVADPDLKHTQLHMGPTGAQPKVRCVGESSTSVPVPRRETVCGLPCALSETDNIPVRFPNCVALKVTSTSQLAPAANELPQVWVCVKSPALGPVTAMRLIVKLVVPMFLSATLDAPFVVPIAEGQKERLVGDRVAIGPEVAATAPLKATCRALPMNLLKPNRPRSIVRTSIEGPLSAGVLGATVVCFCMTDAGIC